MGLRKYKSPKKAPIQARLLLEWSVEAFTSSPRTQRVQGVDPTEEHSEIER